MHALFLRLKTFLLPSLLLSFTIPVSPAFAQDELAELSLEELLNIVVTSTLREQKLKDAPSSVFIITADEIKRRGYKTIKEAMNDVPGFNDVSDTNEEIAAVRGVYTSTTNKILTMINGHRMNDLQLGRYNADQYIGMDIVERIEFIRGPGSALYGSGALVGVVNIITKKGRSIDGTALKARGGLYNTEVSGTWGKKIDNTDILANFTFLNSQGQELTQPASLDKAPEGKEPAAGKVYLGKYPENWSSFVSLNSDNMSLNIRGAHFERVTPRGSNGSFFDYASEPFKPSYIENDFFVDYSYTFNLGSETSTLRFNPSFHSFSYFEKSFITFGANDLPPLGSRSGNISEMQHYQLKLIYENQILDNLNFIAGIDTLLSNQFRTDGAVIEEAEKYVITPQGYTESGNWLLAGALAQVVWSPFNNLTLTTGGRFDTFGTEAPPRFTPRVGIVYHPLDFFTTKLMYGSSYLAPMWAHKRAKDPNFDGNPNLKPESFDGLDLVLMYDNESNFSASLNAYYNSVSGLINSVRKTPDKPLFSYMNSANSVYRGIDLYTKYNLMDWLQLNAGYSLIDPDTVNTTAGLLFENRIKDIPTHTFRYGLTAKPVDNMSLTLWGRTYSEMKVSDPISKNNTLPWTPLLDFSAIYSFGDAERPLMENALRQIDLQLLITNLTNNQYELGGTVDRPLARQGINVEGLVGIKF